MNTSANKIENAISVDKVSVKFRIPAPNTRAYAILRPRAYAYTDLWALRNVSFNVKKGETLGIIGENGSGKTTLLRVMGNILPPTSGRCIVHGKIAPFLELGLGFEPELTARENVYIYGAIMGLGRREIDRRFDDIIAFAGLEQFVDTKLKNFSSGMYMRLGFAIAVSTNPDILLIDEVLAVGDIAFRRKCFEKMNSFKEQGKTIVLVTHRLGDIKKVCDRLLLLHRGRVECTGAPDRVVEHYLNTLMREDVSIGTSGEPSPPITPAVETKRTKKECGAAGKKIEITGVEFTDREGQTHKEFACGDEINIRISYCVRELVKNPHFAVQLYRDDGILCYATNTYRDGVELSELTGDGEIVLKCKSIPYLAGSYNLSVSVWGDALEAPYDVHEKAYSFAIRSKRKDGAGLAKIPHQWIVGRVNVHGSEV